MASLASLYKSVKDGPAQRLEVVVVDNNIDSHLKNKLKKFSKLIYFKSGGDIGFGRACNLGAQKAKGEYLFFLNPDTVVQKTAVQHLSRFLVNHPKAAIVAPTLFTLKGQRFPDQGSGRLTPLAAVGAHSVLHRIWPSNPFAYQYWLQGQDFTQPRELKIAPGTAFMIRRKVFQQIGGFDKRFFLYFEECDLCLRIEKKGWQIWQIPSSHIRHIWHAATQESSYKKVFIESRHKYFEKNYGKFVAGAVETTMQIGKRECVIGLISFLVVALLLIAK